MPRTSLKLLKDMLVHELLLRTRRGATRAVRTAEHARQTALLAVAALWLASVLMWAIIPKSLGFFYYSYLSTILVALPIAGAWDRWGRGRLAGWDEAWATGAVALFIYFYPILAALPLGGPGSFRHWAWFGSWV